MSTYASILAGSPPYWYSFRNSDGINSNCGIKCLSAVRIIGGFVQFEKVS